MIWMVKLVMVNIALDKPLVFCEKMIDERRGLDVTADLKVLSSLRVCRGWFVSVVVAESNRKSQFNRFICSHSVMRYPENLGWWTKKNWCWCRHHHGDHRHDIMCPSGTQIGNLRETKDFPRWICGSPQWRYWRLFFIMKVNSASQLKGFDIPSALKWMFLTAFYVVALSTLPTSSGDLQDNCLVFSSPLDICLSYFLMAPHFPYFILCILPPDDISASFLWFSLASSPCRHSQYPTIEASSLPLFSWCSMVCDSGRTDSNMDRPWDASISRTE